jgi:20S proteasome alpha/beta subunit
MFMSQSPYFAFTEEEFLMTFQVAVGASDGWIMASDTKENRFAGIATKGIRETTDTKKLFYDPGTRTTYMISGDDIGRDAAKDVLDHVKDRGETYPDMDWLQNELPELVSLRWHKKLAQRPASPRTVIFAFGNARPFWELRIQPDSRIERIYTKVCAGDENNAAKFFLEGYYDDNLSVRQLLPLVAHTILMAGKVNSSGVGGLEITFVEEGAHVVWEYGAPELKRLLQRSQDVDRLIEARLLDDGVVPV